MSDATFLWLSVVMVVRISYLNVRIIFFIFLSRIFMMLHYI